MRYEYIIYAPLEGGTFTSLPAIQVVGGDRHDLVEGEFLHKLFEVQRSLPKVSIVQFEDFGDEDQDEMWKIVKVLRDNDFLVIGKEDGGSLPEYFKVCNSIMAKITNDPWLCYGANDILFMPDKLEDPEIRDSHLKKNTGLWLDTTGYPGKEIIDYVNESKYLWHIVGKRLRMEIDQ